MGDCALHRPPRFLRSSVWRATQTHCPIRRLMQSVRRPPDHQCHFHPPQRAASHDASMRRPAGLMSEFLHCRPTRVGTNSSPISTTLRTTARAVGSFSTRNTCSARHLVGAFGSELSPTQIFVSLYVHETSEFHTETAYLTKKRGFWAWSFPHRRARMKPWGRHALLGSGPCHRAVRHAVSRPYALCISWLAAVVAARHHGRDRVGPPNTPPTTAKGGAATREPSKKTRYARRQPALQGSAPAAAPPTVVANPCAPPPRSGRRLRPDHWDHGRSCPRRRRPTYVCRARCPLVGGVRAASGAPTAHTAAPPVRGSVRRASPSPPPRWYGAAGGGRPRPGAAQAVRRTAGVTQQAGRGTHTAASATTCARVPPT